MELFDCYQARIAECDHEIEQALKQQAPLETKEEISNTPVHEKEKKAAQ